MTAQKNLGDRQRCLLLFIDPFSFSYPLLSFLHPLSSLEQMGGWPCGRARELGPASTAAAEPTAASSRVSPGSSPARSEASRGTPYYAADAEPDPVPQVEASVGRNTQMLLLLETEVAPRFLVLDLACRLHSILIASPDSC